MCLVVRKPKPDRRQSKTLLKIDEHGSKMARNSVFDCHLSPVGRQMANKKTLFLTIYNLRSSIVLTFSIAAYPVGNLSSGFATGPEKRESFDVRSFSSIESEQQWYCFSVRMPRWSAPLSFTNNNIRYSHERPLL